MLDVISNEAFPSSNRTSLAVGEETLEASGRLCGAQRNLNPVAEKTERVSDGHAVMPGVTMVSTPGHTPGHMSVMVEDGGRQLLVTGDALTHPNVSFERPDWHFGFDQDPELAARTRATLLDRLARDKVGIIGYHLPWPGVGRVEAGQAGRFRYIAES